MRSQAEVNVAGAVLLLMLVSSHMPSVASDRTKTETYKLVYDELHSFKSCYRRFNGTHEIGCTSTLNGNVGVLHYVNHSDHVDWIIKNGSHAPYIPLIESRFFTGSNIRKLNESGKVNGMLVIYTNTSDVESYPPLPYGFSPDSKCPNEYSSIYSVDKTYSCDQHKFNPTGNGILLENLRMPIMLLTSAEEVERVMSCYQAHNMPSEETGKESVFPLCSAELKAFMNGAGNTEICMRRNNMIRNFAPDSYCQRLGGQSALAFLGEVPQNTTRGKTLVISARTDSFSLFESLVPGTGSPVSALTVLLASAQTLSQNKALRRGILDAGYNILFLALSGESFDYIGSQKLIYDMKQGFFPNSSYDSARMHLSDIDLFIELSQFIDGIKSKEIYSHVDPNTHQKQPNIAKFIEILKALTSTLTFKPATSNQPLPPSSAQMFIRENGYDGIPAVVLGDYDNKYMNAYYNSYLDTPEIRKFYPNRSAVDYSHVTEQAAYLADVATALSAAIYKYTTNSSHDFTASNATTNQLLYCFLISKQCDLFYATIGTDSTKILDASPDPFPLYVSVYDSYYMNQPAQKVVKQLLAFYTGTAIEGYDSSTCTSSQFHPENGVYVNGSLVNGTRTPFCIKSTAQYHNASSPAFEIDNYDFSSHQYSTWAESVWATSAFRVRIFLKPSSEVELASMVAGISIFIATAIAAVYVQKKAGILFPPHDGHVNLVTEVNGPT